MTVQRQIKQWLDEDLPGGVCRKTRRDAGLDKCLRPRGSAGSRGEKTHMESKEHDGWTNYETWAVARWIEKDALSRQHWRETAAEARREVINCPKAAETPCGVGEASRLLLADWIKEEIMDRLPLSEVDIYMDLLNAALAKIKWCDLAAKLLVGIDDETPCKNADEDTYDTYSRAIEVGALFDVTGTAKRAGIKFSVAVTAAVWSQCVIVPEDVQGQDEQSRLWDMLETLRHAITKDRRKSAEPLAFQLMVRNDGQQAQPVMLKAQWGSADETDPVVTVMLPNER